MAGWTPPPPQKPLAVGEWRDALGPRSGPGRGDAAPDGLQAKGLKEGGAAQLGHRRCRPLADADGVGIRISPDGGGLI